MVEAFTAPPGQRSIMCVCKQLTAARNPFFLFFQWRRRAQTRVRTLSLQCSTHEWVARTLYAHSCNLLCKRANPHVTDPVGEARGIVKITHSPLLRNDKRPKTRVRCHTCISPKRHRWRPPMMKWEKRKVCCFRLVAVFILTEWRGGGLISHYLSLSFMSSHTLLPHCNCLV